MINAACCSLAFFSVALQPVDDAPRLELLEPAYRGWLLPEEQTARIASRGAEDGELTYTAALEGGTPRATQGFEGHSASGEIVLDLGELSPGDYTLKVRAKGSGEAIERSFALRKLSAEAARALVATIDRHGRLIWRGKPIFIRGWYSDGSIEKLRRIGESPFNAVLDYGLTGRSVEETSAYLAEAERLGVAVILCVNDVYPSAKSRERLGSWEGNDAILQGVVEAFRASPAAVAWYTNDELPSELASEARGYYERILGLDPSRPQLLAHFKPGSFGVFERTADILALDNYPIPKRSALELARALDGARAELASPRPLWAIVQDFAWYQHRTPAEPIVAGDLETERARLPTAEEWRENRPPTREELRAMSYLALTSGAQGLLYWCLYNLDYLPDREERWADAKLVAGELRELEEVLLSPQSERVKASVEAVQARLFSSGEKTWLIAVNGSSEPLRAELPTAAATTSMAGEGAAPLERARVHFERREVPVKGGRILDFFAPYGRHVYVWDTPRTAADFPQWRGPGRDGRAEGFVSPEPWPEQLARRWSVAVDTGASSPIIVGAAAYVHGRRGEDEVLIKLDLETGERLWESPYPAPYENHFAALRAGPGPRSTPTASGDALFALGASGILTCLAASTGEIRWQQRSAERFPARAWPLYGAALSPLVDSGLCFVHLGGQGDGAMSGFDEATGIGDWTPGQGAGAIFAFEAVGGAVRWSWNGDGPGYSSPIAAELGGVRQCIWLTQRLVIGLDLLRGTLLWKLPFESTFDQNVVTPLVIGDTVIFSGHRSGVIALRVRREGEEWKAEEAWRQRGFSLYTTSPVFSRGRLFGLAQEKKGQLVCLDATKGELVWASEGRLTDHASLLAAGDFVLALTLEGELLVLRADAPRFEPLRRYRVAKTRTYAHPAVAGDRLLVRELERLTLWTVGS